MRSMDDIEEDAKRIMDRFLGVLEKADLPDALVGIDREVATRVPEEKDAPEGFTRAMLENAPKTKDNCIVAEKKSW
ncbi:MAG: hypothetical protein ACOCWQ_00770 [Nanoarchaeota archaeon]